MARQDTLDLVRQVDAPAGAVLVLEVPDGVNEPPVEVLEEMSRRTGLVVIVLAHGTTLAVVDEEQMAAAGWARA